MPKSKHTHFVTRNGAAIERFPWGPHDWLARPDVVDSEHLLAVRIHMPKGQRCPFHRHPHMEEIIYVLQGKAEQWVGEEARILEAGEVAHIPPGVVHATYNAGASVLRLLSVLGPATARAPVLVDCEDEEPWRSIRRLGAASMAKKLRRLHRAKKVAAVHREPAPSRVLKTERGAAKKAMTKRRGPAYRRIGKKS